MEIGKISNNKIHKEYHVQGFIYKNYQAFENKSNDICYIPEMSSDDDDDDLEMHNSYTYEDFLLLAKEYINENESVKKYISKNKLTEHDVAYNLFDMVDWQCPETLIMDWSNMGIFEY